MCWNVLKKMKWLGLFGLVKRIVYVWYFVNVCCMFIVKCVIGVEFG